jgi:hypothetical protein
MSHLCPACSRILYDRRRKTCGYCGATIPESLLLMPEERERHEHEKQLLEKQRLEDRNKAEKERERLSPESSGFEDYGSLDG